MKNFIVVALFATIMMIGLPANAVEIIPKPQSVSEKEGVFTFTSQTRIKYSDELQSAAAYLIAKLPHLKHNRKAAHNFVELTVNKYLSEGIGKEGYYLDINSNSVEIIAATEQGIFYGIQSLIQLLPIKSVAEFTLPQLTIKDKPRFSHRSFMLDESRYFKGKDQVKLIIDQMALMKMNVLHWHLTDDAGWRIEIKKYPNLIKVGSTRKDSQILNWKSDQTLGKPHSGYYTQKDIKEIVAYATARHILVIPEIEMPGHASAAIASYPQLGVLGQLTEVPVRFGKKKDNFDVLNPKTITFLHDVLDEVMALFPSKMIHIGGDEVKFDVWNESKKYQKHMKEKGFVTPADVQMSFINDMSQYLDSKGRRMVGWNEILGLNVHEWMDTKEGTAAQKLAKSAVVQFWKGDEKMIKEAVIRGHDVINSSSPYTYLNLDESRLPLKKVYNFEPVPAGLTKDQSTKIIGVGAQIWSEWLPNEHVLHQKVFPRIAAFAEVSWTEKENKDFSVFSESLMHLKAIWRDNGVKLDKLPQ